MSTGASTEKDYTDLFDSQVEATEYEDQVLGAVDYEALPDCARLVLKGWPATSEYWAWLISQVEDVSYPHPPSPRARAHRPGG